MAVWWTLLRTRVLTTPESSRAWHPLCKLACGALQLAHRMHTQMKASASQAAFAALGRLRAPLLEALALQQDAEKLHAGSSSSPQLAAATMIPARICPEAVHTGWDSAAGAAAAVAVPKDDWQVAGRRRHDARGSRTSADYTLPAAGAPDARRLPASQQSSRATRILRLGDVAGLPLLPTLNGWLLGYPVAYLVCHSAAVCCSVAHCTSDLASYSNLLNRSSTLDLQTQIEKNHHPVALRLMISQHQSA